MKKLDLFICARGNSKGIPRKNLRKFGSKSLIERAVFTAKNCYLVNNIYVSSESDEILELANKAGADYIHKRKSSLSKDNVRQVDVVKDMIKFINNDCTYITEYAVLMQTTTPFLHFKDLNTCIEMNNKMQSTQVISGSRLNINPCELYIDNKQSEIVPLYSSELQSSQRQLQPILYRINGGIRVFNVQNLISSNQFFNSQKV